MPLNLVSLLAMAALAVAPLAASKPTVIGPDDYITIGQNAKFYVGSSDVQFYIKGIAYQYTLDQQDPLAYQYSAQCQYDAKQMANLGANAIRVYHVDPTENHDLCMKAFRDHGIYVFLDLDSDTAPSTDDYNDGIPGPTTDSKSSTWTTTQFQKFAQVAYAFQGYANTAGFFIANEGITGPDYTVRAKNVKAAALDMKHFIKNQPGWRQIPIGYAMADTDISTVALKYFACGEAIDFVALNSYRWGNEGWSPGTDNPYTNYPITQTAEILNIPFFLSETGANVNRPRTFSDWEYMLSSVEMHGANDVYSGAIMYEWANTGNDYGLIDNAEIEKVQKSAATTWLAPESSEIKMLSSRFATLPGSHSRSAEYPIGTPPPCPTSAVGIWSLQASDGTNLAGHTLWSSGMSLSISSQRPSATGGVSTQSMTLVWEPSAK